MVELGLPAPMPMDVVAAVAACSLPPDAYSASG